MVGRTHTGNRRHWLRLKLLAVALVAVAVVAAPASARPDEGSAQLAKASGGYLHASSGGSIVEGDVGLAAEIASLSGASGVTEHKTGVTPTNLARAVEWQAQGGVTPTDLARAFAPLTDEEAALAVDVPYLSHGVGIIEMGVGGVTPTNLARAYDSRRVDEPALIRDVPDGYSGDVRASNPVTVFVSGESSFDERALALGFGLGSVLVAAAVTVLMLSRRRMRIAS